MVDSKEEGKAQTTESTSGKLLAWCTSKNRINIVNPETNQKCAKFDGVFVSSNKSDGNWTHVKKIPNTELLISANHDLENYANLAIFDISQISNVKKIFTFEEVVGNSGIGDVTYNLQRNILGTISVEGKISYHLFTVDTTSKSKDPVKLSRRSKWHSQYSTSEENCITGLDFDLSGKLVATIDKKGVCLISNVDTDEYNFHLEMGDADSRGDIAGSCRWISNPDEPLLYVKYDGGKLNILDVEKKALSLKEPAELDWMEGGYTMSIDVCPRDGNLLAAGGHDGDIKIYDRRESKVVKNFDNQNPKEYDKDIYCVRWNPSGDILANTSTDNTAKLIDFGTGKITFTGKNRDNLKRETKREAGIKGIIEKATNYDENE